MDDASIIRQLDDIYSEPGDLGAAPWAIIKKSLQSNADALEKASIMANQLRAHVGVNPKEEPWFLLWGVFHAITWTLPPDHHWQNIMVRVLQTLSQFDGPDTGRGIDKQFQWRALPRFGASVRDVFSDPTWQTEADGGFTVEEAEGWRNFSSFLARLGGIKPCRFLDFPIWQLRGDLEQPIPDQSPKLSVLLDVRLFIDTEWLLHHGHHLWNFFHDQDYVPNEDDDARYAPGPLAEGMGVFSVERWEFWKCRLLEIAGVYKVELESSMVERIGRTVEKMNEIEEQWEKKTKRKARRNRKSLAKSLAKRRTRRHSRRQARR